MSVRDFAGWVRVAGFVALTGYALVTASDMWLSRSEPWGYEMVTQLLGALGCAVAVFLTGRGKADLAALMLVVVVWLDLHAGIANRGIVGSSALIVFPTMTAATALLWGGKGGFLFAGVSSVSIPLVALAGHSLRGLPPADSPEAVHRVMVTAMAMLGSAAMMHLGLAALGRVLTAAQASGQRLADLHRYSPDGMVSADARGGILSANPAAERLLGEDQDALRSRSIGEVLAGVGAKAVDQAALRDLVTTQGGAPVSVRLRGVGKVWSVDAVATEVPQADGSVGVQVTLRDVTEQRESERSQQMLQVQLEHALRLEAIGRLAGGVAHDFNNLLTAVGGSAELIIEEGDANTRELAEEILEAQSRGATLTRQLLAFARKEMIRPIEIDPVSVVLELRPLLERFLTEQVFLCLDAVQACPPIVADRSQLEQVFINLAVNAKDAAARRVTVSVYPPGAPRYRPGYPSWRVRERFVEMAVEDDGQGMDAETQTRVFEPFFTTKPRGQGTGLGLATVHGIVTQNGGSLSVLSEPGRGTAMSILWPVAP